MFLTLKAVVAIGAFLKCGGKTFLYSPSSLSPTKTPIKARVFAKKASTPETRFTNLFRFICHGF
jgi:hypothetical protein